MKLLNSLYTIHAEATSPSLRYDIHLDASHLIYQAHFPGEPITPGVCILQIARELLERAYGQRLCIESVKNVKYLNVISPIEMPDISYVFSPVKDWKVQVEVLGRGQLLTKLSFTCKQR